ncbi:MAG: mandelate racemase [Armatimonadetes bacterium]|nr:mandelate racemase [Armatimonadota bacterium]
MNAGRIEKIEVFPLNLPFLTEFKISRGSVGGPKAGAPHVYIRIAMDSGAVGWGEARPSPRWSYETLESVVTTIRNYLAPALVGLDADDFETAHQIMDREIAPGITVGQPVAKSGIDMALHDLAAKSLDLPLYRFLGADRASGVPLSYLVSVDSPAKAEEVTAAAVSTGYTGFKVKIGMDPSLDLELIRAVKRIAGDCFLWADANQAYGVELAVERSRDMAEIGVHVLEQPGPANAFLGLRDRVARSAVPIAVDESVFSAGDLEQLIRLKALDMLVIKVSKMAGLTGARKCIERALSEGIELLGSGLTETRLGLAASAHLYSAFGFKHPVDLNGPQFLADDPVKSGVTINRATVSLSDAPGIGIEVDEEKLAQYAVRS